MSPTYTLLGLLFLVVIVGGPFFKSWANRKAGAWGEKKGKDFSANKQVQVLAQLGAPLVLETNLAGARRVVDAAVATKPKRFPVLEDGVWGITFVESDDVRVRLVPAGSSAQLQVETFRDYFGFPQGLPYWEDLVKRVRKAAAAAHVPVRAGSEVLAYDRTEQIDGNNWRWTRVG